MYWTIRQTREAKQTIAQRIEVRNLYKTSKIKATISAAKTDRDGTVMAASASIVVGKRASGRERKYISIAYVAGVKKVLSNFSDELFDAKNALWDGF